MVGNTALIVVAALSAWLLLSVLVGIAVGACLRPRARVIDGSSRLERAVRQSVRAA